jgi:hypothetical protein
VLFRFEHNKTGRKCLSNVKIRFCNKLSISELQNDRYYNFYQVVNS